MTGACPLMRSSSPSTCGEPVWPLKSLYLSRNSSGSSHCYAGYQQHWNSALKGILLNIGNVIQSGSLGTSLTFSRSTHWMPLLSRSAVSSSRNTCRTRQVLCAVIQCASLPEIALASFQGWTRAWHKEMNDVGCKYTNARRSSNRRTCPSRPFRLPALLTSMHGKPAATISVSCAGRLGKNATHGKSSDQV